MNPSFHYTWTAESSPITTSEGNPVPELFGLELRYRPDGEPHRYSGVHIPKTLQAALAGGGVKGLHIETLDFNGLASRCLPNSPKYVVTGLITRDGTKLMEVPKPLRLARRICFGIGTAACAVGAVLLTVSYGWLGAVAFVIGTHCWRSALLVPRSPNIKDGELPPKWPVFVAFPVKNT